MLRMKKTLAIAALFCTVTATSAIAESVPVNGSESLALESLENIHEVPEADHIDPAFLAMESAQLASDRAGMDSSDPYDDFGYPAVPVEPREEKASNACIQQAIECAAISLRTPLACAATIISFGQTAIECVAELAVGGDVCAEVNEKCDIPTGTPPTTQSQFYGTTSGPGNSTKVCGGVDRVRSAFFWWDTHHQWGITVISKVRLYCTDGGSMTFGNNNGVSNGGWGANCHAGNLIQGLDVRYGALIDGAAPRCDNVRNTTGGDWIGTWRGGNGGTKKTMECSEGRYAYGMRAYYGNGPNAGVNYISGFNLLCRP